MPAENKQQKNKLATVTFDESYPLSSSSSSITAESISFLTLSTVSFPLPHSCSPSPPSGPFIPHLHWRWLLVSSHPSPLVARGLLPLCILCRSSSLLSASWVHICLHSSLEAFISTCSRVFSLDRWPSSRVVVLVWSSWLWCLCSLERYGFIAAILVEPAVRFHAPTRWTQKLKLLGRDGQSTNTSQHSHSHAAGIRRKCGNKGSGGLKRCLYHDSNSRPLALIPY